MVAGPMAGDALRRPRRRSHEGRAAQGRRPHAAARPPGRRHRRAVGRREPRQAQPGDRPPARRRARSRCATWSPAPTCSSRTSGPGWPSGWASTRPRCAPSTPASSTCRSADSARAGRTSIRRATTTSSRCCRAWPRCRAATATPSLIRNIVIDKVTAMTAAQSVLAALLARERGAGGQHIRLSMIDTALAFLWPDGMMQHTLLADDGCVTPGPHMADGYVVRPHDGPLPRDDRHVELAVPRACARRWARRSGSPTRASPRSPTARPTPTNCRELITAEVAEHHGERAGRRAARPRRAVRAGEPGRPRCTSTRRCSTTGSSSSTSGRGWARCASRGRRRTFSATPTALGRHARSSTSTPTRSSPSSAAPRRHRRPARPAAPSDRGRAP